jgi:predicted ester cyclase
MENVDVVRAIEDAWASNDLDALDQYFAPNWQPHTPGSEEIGNDLNVVKGAHQQSMQAFPDRQNTARDLIAEGDLVVSRVEMTGTNEGGMPWFGIPANGKKVDVEWITIYRLDGGKVVETWAQMELPKMMMQLGAMPAPEGM